VSVESDVFLSELQQRRTELWRGWTHRTMAYNVCRLHVSVAHFKHSLFIRKMTTDVCDQIKLFQKRQTRK